MVTVTNKFGGKELNYRKMAAVLSIASFLTVQINLPVKANERTQDQLYFSAYAMTQSAKVNKTQKSVDYARIEINNLPEELNWAKAVFNQEVDSVQQNLLNSATEAYEKAEQSGIQQDIDNAQKLSTDIEGSSDNYIEYLGKNLSGQVGKITYDYAFKEMQGKQYNLPNVQNAIKNKKSLKVAFWGDSITEGSNIIAADAYPQLFISALKSKEPNVAVDYTNFALGARNTSNAIDVNYKANNPEQAYNAAKGGYVDFWRSWSKQGVSWEEHIADYQPDLLFIAFGMNDVTNNLSDYKYEQNLDKMIKYIKTSSPKTDIVLVSNILSTENKQLYAQSTTHTIQVARTTREYAENNNMPLVDANRLWRILLYGKDEERFNDEELNSVKEIDGTSCYNGTLEFSLKNYPTSASPVEISFRVQQGEGGLMFKTYSSMGQNKIDLYSMDDGMDKPGTLVQSFGAQEENKIELKGSNITVNGKTIILYKDLRDGNIEFLNGSATIEGIRFTKAAFNSQAPLYQEGEMLGTVNGSASSGNGINHPTALGMKLSYFNAISPILNSIK